MIHFVLKQELYKIMFIISNFIVTDFVFETQMFPLHNFKYALIENTMF